MQLAHTVQIHDEHASLEVRIWVTHMQLMDRICHALAIFYIKVAEKIGIRHSADCGVAQIGVIQFRNISVDY